MKTTIIFIGLLCSILASPNPANGADPAPASIQYEVRTYVLSASTNKTDNLVFLSSKAGIFRNDSDTSGASFIPLGEIKLGGHVLESDDSGRLLWDGQPARPKDSPFQLLGSPGAITVEGQRTSLIQTDPVEYFEKSGNVYVLKTTPPDASPSISMDFAVNSRGDEQVEVDFHLVLSVMTGRKTLTSTRLDVGEPILKKKEMPLKLEAPLNQWLIPAMFTTEKTTAGNQQHLMVLMMIRRLK